MLPWTINFWMVKLNPLSNETSNQKWYRINIFNVNFDHVNYISQFIYLQPITSGHFEFCFWAKTLLEASLKCSYISRFLIYFFKQQCLTFVSGFTNRHEFVSFSLSMVLTWNSFTLRSPQLLPNCSRVWKFYGV